MLALVFRLLILCCMLLGPLSWPSEASAETVPSILSRADRLIKTHHPDDAYKLLAPLEEKLAGQRDYDYLLALAELDSGRAELATIALERVLIVDPKFAGARMALARAYYAMGDYTNAKTEFTKVLGYNPPPQVRVAVNQYLAAIKARTEPRHTQAHGYLSVRFGHDSDINNGPGISTFAIPALNNLQVTLSSTNQRIGDIYGELDGGISVEHQALPSLGFYAGLDANRKNFSHNHSLAQMGFNGSFGTKLGSGQDTVRIGGLAGQSYLGTSRYYRLRGINATWQHIQNRRNAWTLFAQFNTIRYNHTAMFYYNVDQTLAGISESHAIDSRGRFIIAASLYGGFEHDTHSRPDGAKNLWGGNLGAQAKLTRHFSLYGSFGAQAGDYKKENAAFLMIRRDKLYSGAIGLAWLLAKNLSLRGEVDYSNNSSNIVLYQYHRTDASVTLRRDFN